MANSDKFNPGGDMQAVADIAEKFFGGYREMFDHHGWDAPGNKLMTSAPRLIVEKYGSIKAFQHAYQTREPLSIWDNKSVYITSFWGWTPETWGTVGFTVATRLKNVVAATTNPFLMVVYVTKHYPDSPEFLRGKVVGFYEVTHEEGHRDEFTASVHHNRNPEKWQWSLRARRAFEIVPEYRIAIDEFDPTIQRRAQSVAQWAEEVSPEKIELLKTLPIREVPVYRGNAVINPDIVFPSSGANKVRGGAPNYSGYSVPGEPEDAPKELYVLRLDGDQSAFLGYPAGENHIYKIGLSMSPETRREALQRALPSGAYSWFVQRTTRNDGHDPYPGFKAAEAGETAMKDYLGDSQNGKWLGGEFYATTAGHLERAWNIGREAALAAAETRKP